MMLSITKLQNLKAIHNVRRNRTNKRQDVINHKTTKFESNSQRRSRRFSPPNRCYQSQNYKIWKQFTTYKQLKTAKNKMLSITKLQNLKAIHNHITMEWITEVVVINHKTTKFESNSQRTYFSERFLNGCYQSQNYKIWKQFTTVSDIKERAERLLSITKLQNLKAIHNIFWEATNPLGDVINHKTTKFESNSQP